jgi:ATP-dependent helicase/nuclease subunit A
MLNVHETIAANQLAASNPQANVWVNASAGSGKTKVLIDRLLRLLLQGANPKAIVCITFTQAAALEMKLRLQHILEEWAVLSNEDLRQRLMQLDPNLDVNSKLTEKARLLLNQVFDEPVQIQTIHSFSQTILSSCPVESNVPFASQLMDDVTMKRLIKQATSALFKQQKSSSDLTRVYTLFSNAKFNDIVTKILDEQAFFRFILMEGIDVFEQRLKSYLGHPRTEADVLEEIAFSLGAFDFDRWVDVPEASDNDKIFIDAVLKALKSQRLEPLTDVLLTEKGTPRKRLVSKKVSEAYPSKSSQLVELTQTVFDWDQEIKRSKTIDSTMIVVKLAAAFLNDYSELKLNKGYLDYDDLIFKTLEVLSDPAVAQNILYKLDRKIDHILVDEAQDTNLYQWKLIDCIVDGFFQHEDHKSIFVVGDHKQAIFGFQGTDPDIFHHIKTLYLNKPSLRQWNDISLDVSFRSLQRVLDFVDGIFEHTSLIEFYSSHTAFQGAGGKIKLHPLCTAEEGSKESCTEDNIEDVYEVFAGQVAAEIKQLIGTEIIYKGKTHKVRPQDILILIRRRGEHLDHLQNALKDQGVPFSAPNRQLIHEDHLVQFILQTIALINQPLDHDTVMQWMLNPLLDMAKEGLEYAVQRVASHQSLISYLKEDSKFISLMSTVENYSSLDDMYMKICMWAIEHLQVDDYSISNAFTLLDSIKIWKANRDLRVAHSELHQYVKSLPVPQVNRTENDALRILTVHGAKGLQSPIVMLVDSTQLPIVRNVFASDDSESLFLCTATAKEETTEYKELKARHKESQMKEYYRLLYVALTRAECELHIFGATKTKVSPDSWYGLVVE